MRPFGFEPDRYTVRVDEADLIRTAAARVIKGDSLMSIVTEWNEREIPTPSGKTWQQGVLRRVLRSHRIAGKRVRPDGEVVDADYPAILDDETFSRLNEQMDIPKPGPSSPSTVRTYLLTGGIAKCGLCGKDLLSRPDTKGKRSYACSSASPTFGCGKIRINGELLDDEVATRVIARLIQPGTRDRIERLIADTKTRAESADEEIAQAKARLSDLGEEYAKGNIVAATMRTATDRINAEVAEARRVRRTAESLENIAVLEARDLIEWWEGASIEQQRTLLSVLIKEVDVMPAPVRGSKTFAPERVKVRWK